jgi:hypothetical protein
LPLRDSSFVFRDSYVVAGRSRTAKGNQLFNGFRASQKEGSMRSFKYLFLAAAACLCLAAAVPSAQAQVSVSVGVAPECPYGYYDYPPYSCAPYGYYGPEWFTGGLFVGAGPWFHGSSHFNGHVDNHFDPHHGYKGAFPTRGEHPRPENHVDKMPKFHGNESRDGRGHGK